MSPPVWIIYVAASGAPNILREDYAGAGKPNFTSYNAPLTIIAPRHPIELDSLIG
jgi:hypothetical protein